MAQKQAARGRVRVRYEIEPRPCTYRLRDADGSVIGECGSVALVETVLGDPQCLIHAARDFALHELRLIGHDLFLTELTLRDDAGRA